MDDGEKSGEYEKKNKCLFALVIVWVFLKDPMSPTCFHHSSSLSFGVKIESYSNTALYERPSQSTLAATATPAL